MSAISDCSNMELSVLCLLTLGVAFVPQLSALSLVPLVRDGSCPKNIVESELSLVRCLTNCSTDNDCPQPQKCCKNACGDKGICKTPIKVPKPGFCPTPERFGICVELCTNDNDCNGKLKCCSNGCGHSCMTPLMKEKNGCCPFPFNHLKCRRKDQCQNDLECKGGLKCCFDGCSKICRMPLGKKKGTCPAEIPHLVECDPECDNHNDCEGGLLCCFSGCGMQCLEPV